MAYNVEKQNYATGDPLYRVMYQNADTGSRWHVGTYSDSTIARTVADFLGNVAAQDANLANARALVGESRR